MSDTQYKNLSFWIFPWNPQEFKLFSYIGEDGSLQWRQTATPMIGDIVFIYASKEVHQIVLMAEVICINIPFKDSVYGEDYEKHFKTLNATDYCFSARIIQTVDYKVDTLSYKNLKALGLQSQLQGPLRVKDESLVDYIISNFDVVYDVEMKKFFEGIGTKQSIIRYERNIDARSESIKQYGYTCQVCRLTLEEKYGKIAENYIHVHHVEFISSFKGIPHEIKPVGGLIPVCPNCHAMLHHKVDGKYLTPDELRDILKKRSK